jgi:hypothetical protein
MKKLLFAMSVLAAVICGCNDREVAKERHLYNKEFDWTITIPEGFDTLTAEEWDRIQGKGAEAIKKTYGVEIESRPHTIFVFRNNKLNSFEANWEPFDTLTDGDFDELSQLTNEMIYGTFEAQMPDAKLDSSSSTETISGLEFRVFSVNLKMPNKTTLECMHFTRLFGNRTLSVNITTLEKKKKEAMLKAWRSSKFGRES